MSRLILKAAAYAAHQHRDQRRKDAEASPYINHPLTVANILSEAGVENPIVLAAAILHDTIEDTTTTADDLRRLFGEEVAGIVLEVTDDKSLPKARRKVLQIEHAPHLSEGAALVKFADKIANLTDILEAPPAWPAERKAAYFAWAASVVDFLPVQPLALRARFDALVARASVPTAASSATGPRPNSSVCPSNFSMTGMKE